MLPIALAVAGDTVYVGGSFDRVGDVRRSNLAAVDARTGELLPDWRADVGGYVDYYAVEALTVAGDRVYVGGTFHSIAGQPRANLAAVSAATGVPLAWDPRPDDTVSSVAVSGEQVVAGGSFLGVGSESRGTPAAVDLTTAAPLPLTTSYRPGDGNLLETLAVDGDTAFAAESATGEAAQAANSAGSTCGPAVCGAGRRGARPGSTTRSPCTAGACTSAATSARSAVAAARVSRRSTPAPDA